jgi:hypothetical protein
MMEKEVVIIIVLVLIAIALPLIGIFCELVEIRKIMEKRK